MLAVVAVFIPNRIVGSESIIARGLFTDARLQTHLRNIPGGQ